MRGTSAKSKPPRESTWWKTAYTSTNSTSTMKTCDTTSTANDVRYDAWAATRDRTICR